MKVIITISIILFSLQLFAQDSTTTQWMTVANQAIEVKDTSWVSITWKSFSADEPMIKVDSLKIQYRNFDGVIKQRQRFYYTK